MDSSFPLQSSRWRPTATSEALVFRARSLERIRAFFRDREVLEVETPLLAPFGTVDQWIDSFRVESILHRDGLWLQTSPEFYMKRLLAAGSGPIWQLCKAFRDEGEGTRHLREFSILEWYRPGWSLEELCREIWELCRAVVPQTPEYEVRTFRDLYLEKAGVDPFLATIESLREAASQFCVILPQLPMDDRDGWLDLLMVSAIEPGLGQERPVFVTGYPPSRAALAKVDPGPPATACRAELYWKGVELCNAYDELCAPEELLVRFEADAAARRAIGKDTPRIDHGLVQAQREGLPPTSGVALGVDRLLLLAQGLTRIEQTVAFGRD